jgi:hypothetical protein
VNRETLARMSLEVAEALAVNPETLARTSLEFAEAPQ